MQATKSWRLVARRSAPLVAGIAVALAAVVLWQALNEREAALVGRSGTPSHPAVGRSGIPSHPAVGRSGTPSHLAQPSILPETILVAGLLLGALLASALHLFQKARDRAHGLENAHAGLQQAEQRFRATVESAPVGMVMADRRGTMVLVNKEAEKLFGYRREELLGQPVEILVPARYRGAHPGYRAGFLAAPEARRMGAGRDLFAARKDGSELPVEIGLSPIETDDGLFVLSAIVDITGRKRAEREVRELNERLEQRVAERTAQAEARAAELQRTTDALKQEIARRKSAEGELRAAMEAAEAGSRAKSAFLANMSHEIRTPLNAVIGLTSLVLDTDLGAEQREYLELVRESGDSLLQVINDILDFSKIEAGRIELECVVFDHAEMLGNTMKVMGLRAHGKGIELLHRAAPDVPAVLVGDPGRLRQVLVNLVGNALKFTDRGEVMTNVEVDSRNGREVELHYTVTDTGVGIPPGKLDDIFQAFQQLETTTTKRFGGTGLGLAICRRLVELMGGRIWVESRMGGGTKFHFTAKLTAAERPPAEPATPEQVRGMPVLVVDDNATGRRILCEMLRNWSMAPAEAADGLEAVRALHEAAGSGQPFKLVLSDAHMPRMDGFALAGQIAADERLSGTVIMMLSSGDRPGDLGRCERLGVATHLIKPVKQSELLDAIMLALRVTPVGERPDEAEAPGVRLAPLRILLAEDSPVNQKLASVLLKRQGHRVEVAGNGREALEKLKSERFDLVLMDVQMPEMDGLDATKIIRARERLTGRHLPIVALTAHAMKGDEQRCLDAGMDDYVAKPLRTGELFSAMARALRGARPQAGEPGPAPGGASGADLPGRDAAPESSPVPVEPNGPIDWPVALEKAHHDEQLLADLARLLVDELPGRLAEIDEAFARGDAAGAERAAHTLKGQFRVFGAHAAADYALEVETGARDGDPAAENRWASLKREAQRVRAALLEFAGAHAR